MSDGEIRYKINTFVRRIRNIVENIIYVDKVDIKNWYTLKLSAYCLSRPKGSNSYAQIELLLHLNKVGALIKVILTGSRNASYSNLSLW